MMKSRYSFARETILNIVKSTNTHPTADEIYREVALSIPHISLNTVYKNLSQLINNKIVNEIQFDGKAHYCGNPTPHLHIHCLICNNLSDGVINNDEFLNCFNIGNFEVSDYYVEIRGVCKNCRQKEKIKTMENQVIKRIRRPIQS